MLLDEYTNSDVIQQTTSEGTPFAQRGGDSNKPLPLYDKNNWIIWNASDAYIKYTKNHIAKKLFAAQTILNKMMTTNEIPVSRVIPVIRQQV